MESIDAIAQNIEDHVLLTSQLEMICKYYKIPLIASPLYNFRDALSHYVLRYEATTDEEKITQEASIKEHLFRGTKDIFVSILYEMKQRVINALKKAIPGKQEQDLRKLLHKYKKLEIEIRKNTESTVIRSLTSFVENLNNLIEETKKVFEQYSVPFIINKNYSPLAV